MDSAAVVCDSFPVSDSVDARQKLKSIQVEDLNSGYFFAGYDSIVYNKNLIEAWYRSGMKFYWDTVVIKESDKLTALEADPENQEKYSISLML